MYVGRGVVEGCADVADGDAYEVDPSPVASERGHQGAVLVGCLLELLVAAEVPALADLEEGEREQTLRLKDESISGTGSAGSPRA